MVILKSIFFKYIVRYLDHYPQVQLQYSSRKLLAKCLESAKMKNLNLSENDINDEDFFTMINVLHSTNIENLNLSDNSITSIGVHQFIHRFPRTKIKEINLLGNPIEDHLKIELNWDYKDEHTKILSGLNICLKMTPIKKLDLSKNNLGNNII